MAGYTFSNPLTNFDFQSPVSNFQFPEGKREQDISDTYVNKKRSPQFLIQRQLSEKQSLNSETSAKNETSIAFTTWPIPNPFANNVALMRSIESQPTRLNNNLLDDELDAYTGGVKKMQNKGS